MEEKIYKKVCQLCGKEYETDKYRKRYCPKCSVSVIREREKREHQEYKKPEAVKKVPKVKRQAKKKSTAPDMKRCKNCFYGAILDGHTPICDYISITGHSRPCLPGADCTEFKLKENRNRKSRKQITFSGTSETEFGSYVQDSMFRTEKRRRR